MNIDIKDTLTLSNDNEYIVVSKVNYENNIYYYLINIDDTTDVKFCIEKSDTNMLTEVKDEDLLKTLLPMFLKIGKEYV